MNELVAGRRKFVPAQAFPDDANDVGFLAVIVELAGKLCAGYEHFFHHIDPYMQFMASGVARRSTAGQRHALCRLVGLAALPTTRKQELSTAARSSAGRSEPEADGRFELKGNKTEMPACAGIRCDNHGQDQPAMAVAVWSLLSISGRNALIRFST